MADKTSNGVNWPIVKGNDRSTTETNKKVFAVATKAGDESAANAISNERGWRHKYDRHVAAHVKACLKSSETAVNVAKAGLNELHKSFEFIRDGETRSVAEAMEHYTGTMETGVMHGEGSKKEFELPYQGKTLRGEQIVSLCNAWAAKGVLEPDAAKAIIGVVRNKDWSDFKNKVFVLMGAGAAMGPFQTLMAMGANVVAIDINIPGVWERLFQTAQKSAGTFTFPLKKPQSECTTPKDLAANAGCDLITQAPEIANWIISLFPDKQIVLGSYVYLDSALFVKVSVACDAIISKVCKARKDTALAMLGTPTDVYVIPDAARRAAMANHSLMNPKNLALLPASVVGKLVSLCVPGKRILVPNYGRGIKSADGKDNFFLCEGITVPQGPNYILSKRMQQWRCVVARSEGHITSFNVAPSTRTISVIKNRTFRWAYDGMSFFPAVEIFDQETSNPVMTALLLADLNDSESAANPKTELRNPLEMFSKNAIHGGAWRMPYKFNSVGEIAVLIHFMKAYGKFALIILFVLIYLIMRGSRK